MKPGFFPHHAQGEARVMYRRAAWLPERSYSSFELGWSIRIVIGLADRPGSSAFSCIGHAMIPNWCYSLEIQRITCFLIGKRFLRFTDCGNASSHGWDEVAGLTVRLRFTIAADPASVVSHKTKAGPRNLEA